MPDATTEPEFDRDTCLEAAGEGRFARDLAPGWVVGGGLNGGYLLAVVGHALRRTRPERPDPIAVSAYYLSASVPGPATVTTRVLRDGGSTATMAADLEQGGDARLTALATYGDLAALPTDVRTTAEEPAMPPPEECVPNTMAPPEVLAAAPLLQRFDMRFDPASSAGRWGSRVGTAPAGVVPAGRRPRPRPAVAADGGRRAAAGDLRPRDAGLGADARADRARPGPPAPGWLKVRHATRNLAGGMFEEDCEVWDSAGRLVAQSRQLARQPR